MNDRLTMLIVDDVEINRAILAQFFSEDYHIVEAGNGQEALDIIESQRIDIVMLDLVMPMKDDLVGFLSASDSVMHSLNQLLNEENRENINKSLNDLRILTNHLSGNSHRIDSVMKNFTKIDLCSNNLVLKKLFL